MIDFYPPDIRRFKFVWEALTHKIRNKEVIVIDKVVRELKKHKSQKQFVDDFLSNINDYLEKSSAQSNAEIIRIYEQNRDTLKGNFNNFSKDSSADLSLIGVVYSLNNQPKNQSGQPPLMKPEENQVFILTDEIMPNTPDKQGRKKLNIPSFAELVGIECLELKDSINRILR